MDKEHAREVAKELIKTNNKLLWTCEARANLDFENPFSYEKSGMQINCIRF